MTRTILAACALALLLASPALALRITSDNTTIRVYDNQQLLLEYRIADVPFKPYAKQLTTPAGVNVLRDAPHDHLHHHALMFAIAADGVDFWTETPTCGRQVHKKTELVRTTQRDGWGVGTLRELLEWQSAKDEPILDEHRAIDVYRDAKLGAALLTWTSQLQPSRGRKSVALSGSHYFGLGMRFVESMDKGGRFLYAGGKPGEIVRGDERLTRGNWCAYTAKADGKDVTVAMFAHPDNPRHPAYWFTMSQPFAYISGTLNLWKEPMTLKEGESLSVRYGVAAWDGAVESGVIEKLYQHWSKLAATEELDPQK